MELQPLADDDMELATHAGYVSFGETPDEEGKDSEAAGYVISVDLTGGHEYEKPEERCPLIKFWTQDGKLRALNCGQKSLHNRIKDQVELGKLTEGAVFKVTFDGWSNKDDRERCSKEQQKKNDFKSFSVRVRPAGMVTDEYLAAHFPPLTQIDGEPF